MEKNSKIYVAGHQGMVGSALVRQLQQSGYNNLVLKTKAELDLTNTVDVKNFFDHEKPEFVFLAAAKVGGIQANNTYPADFILTNLQIQTNVISQAFANKVKKLLFLSSSCVYPKEAPQPIKEEYLLTGSLEPTNEPFAVAKLAGIKLCESLNRQYQTNFFTVMSTNLYGLNDNFDPFNSHVLSALIKKFHEAKINQIKEVTLWGTGQPLRDFLFADDLADACINLMNKYEGKDLVNVATGVNVTIAQLAEAVKKIIGYTGNINWDTSKPDGTYKKDLDLTKINKFDWHYKTSLNEGLAKTYDWFQKNYLN